MSVYKATQFVSPDGWMDEWVNQTLDFVIGDGCLFPVSNHECYGESLFVDPEVDTQTVDLVVKGV